MKGSIRSQFGLKLFLITMLLAIMTVLPLSKIITRAHARALISATDTNVTVAPSSGPPGTQVTGTGDDWISGHQIDITWDDIDGTVLASITVGNNGTFTVPFTIPANATPGNHTISFVDSAETNLGFFIPVNFNVTVASTPTLMSDTPTGSCNVTYGCGVGSSHLTRYQGSGYTIDFPGSWAIKSDGSSGNVFSMPDGSASLHVFVQNGTDSINPLQYEFGTLAKDNCKAVGNGLQRVQVSGEAWLQSQFVCTPADNGQAGGKVEQIGIMISTCLHNNKSYSMDYLAGPDNFNNAYQNFFKPMVASFKQQ